MRHMWRARRSELRALAAACVLAIVPLAAGSADSPKGAAAEKVFELTVAGGKTAAAGQTLRVEKNDLVTLRISTDTAGEVHLHAYRKDAKLAPGSAAEMSFKAHATGRFRIEWHGAADKNTKAGAHHAPPLAILEVRPK